MTSEMILYVIVSLFTCNLFMVRSWLFFNNVIVFLLMKYF